MNLVLIELTERLGIYEASKSLGLLGLLQDESLVNVGDHTTSSDGGLDESVELFVSSDCKLEMSGCDSLHLEVLAGIAGQLKDFGGEVLQDGSCVDS